MHLLLQLWAGMFYLLNKVFFSFYERANKNGNAAAAKRWRIVSWAIYLLGLPPWIIIFISKHNWIAASVEASGAPTMLLGLVAALSGDERKTPRWLDRLAIVCIVVGFSFSIYDFGGLNTLNQYLEMGLVMGFLVGTYLLAKKKTSGYLWFILMHISAGWLMWIQDSPWLFLQQVISLFFIVYAYSLSRSK